MNLETVNVLFHFIEMNQPLKKTIQGRFRIENEIRDILDSRIPFHPFPLRFLTDTLGPKHP